MYRNIEKDALQLRQKYGINGYGIEDIFSLVERMDIILIRYPLGKNSICGFCTVYEGRKVIVSNTNKILSREIFTVAHEIAHCIYDLDRDKSIIQIDTDVYQDSIIEQKANAFAAAFLMPKSKLCEYIEQEINKSPKNLDSLDIVKIQDEFSVSYQAVVIRLESLELITKNKKEKLMKEQKEKTSTLLFNLINANKHLLESYDKTQASDKYYRYVTSNYKNGYINFEKFKEALDILNVDEEEINKCKINTDADEDESCEWDDIDYEYFD